MNMRYSEVEYINFDPVAGDMDIHIRNQTIKLVKVRKEYVCHISLMENKPHNIKKGEFARVETAIIDDEWWSCYCCIPCIDKILDEENGLWCCECQWYDYENEENDEAFCLSEHSGYHMTLVNYQHSCPKFRQVEEEE